MFAVLLSIAAAGAFAPPETRQELEAQILAADYVLFDKGFNQCDIEALENIMLDDVVMVHDQGGVDEGKEAFLEPIRKHICSGGPQKPLRRIDEHTTEIYPLYSDGELYGAIQSGLHSFFIKEEGKEPYQTNQARYISLWMLKEDGWKFKQALSWDHMNPRENGPLDTDVLIAGFDRGAYIADLMKTHNVLSFSIGVIENGVLTEARTFGELKAGAPAPMDAIYNVASLAKPVSALVALRMADAGEWDLDEPLSNYYVDPDLRGTPQLKKLTTRRVLTHTTGLPNWRYLTSRGKLEFEFEPGEKYQYSGEGFEMMRRAIEAKTGESFETLADKYVFEPAGLRDTSYLYPADKAPRIAQPHDETGALIEHAPHEEANAAANLMTTAADYGRFVAYVMNGGGLSDALAAEMLSVAVEQQPGIGFGLGWSIIPELGDGGFAIQHTGSDNGVKAIALGFPQSGDGIVILSNSENAMATWQGILFEQLEQRGREVVERNRDGN